jgi:hypothetical protein
MGIHLRAWLVSLGAAFVGWLAVVLIVLTDLRFGLWPLFATVVATPTLPALYARTTSLRAVEVWGFTFASMLLGWPILWFATVIVRYWITGEPIGE